MVTQKRRARNHVKGRNGHSWWQEKKVKRKEEKEQEVNKKLNMVNGGSIFWPAKAV